jgi:hypothetical protein
MFTPGVDVQVSRGWADAIVGMSARKTLPNHWWASGYGYFF